MDNNRYQNATPIGSGAFGAVIHAYDTNTGKHVAIKKILEPFLSVTHAKRTYRELKLLMYLNHRDAQVIQLYNVFTPETNVNEFQTLYFVLNYAGSDLNRVIERRIPFLEEHIKQMIYSILRGLKFIHSAGIIHRDLKPSNIGIDQNSNITLLDFGLARRQSTDLQTGYVCTRWWRAPEVSLTPERYDGKIDIWSVGCIMGELIVLEPIFRGTDQIDQLKKIFEKIGTPDPAVLNEICTPEAARYVTNMPAQPAQDFNELFGFKHREGNNEPVSGVSPQGVDLLKRLLTFDPRLRPSAHEALAHPFLADYHDPEEEPTREPMVDEHLDAIYSIAQWKSIVWQLIHDFVPPPWINQNADDDD